MADDGNQPAGAAYDASPFVPSTRDLAALAGAARECRGCPLFVDTTQTVFGHGAETASLILVGEQPGDQEDRRGQPFVGPAGAVLWQCVEAAGIAPGDVYATNAVKHFKHELRGKRRLHKKPGTDEIEACHPWLDAELAVLAGTVIVALGATAARSLLRRTTAIAASRGTTFDVGGRPTIVTYHPSAVLRADDRAAEVRAALIEDLRRAHTLTQR
jgi:uracil-DNA glycosylase family protein